ncbi:hypothetical protein [[Eubacterium] cellulosolvens]
MAKNEEKVNGGINMNRRQMTPAIKNITVIDLTNFLIAITWSEFAIKKTISKLKQELFRIRRKGG